MTRRTLTSLLQELHGAELIRGNPDVVVESVQADSRSAAPGTLFVAVPGFRVDGHDFLSQVVQAGAVALIVQRDHRAQWQDLAGDTAIIAVDETRPAIAAAAAWFYGHPSREMTVIGITGTDGKTTTSHMLSSVIEAAGGVVGRLGTVDVYIPGAVAGKGQERMTTPEAHEVQRLLRQMADAGCDHAIVESTSHGLALHRLDHLDYDIGAFTNITGDHLDFHETFEAYREAKGKLFEALGRGPSAAGRWAVVNVDDPSAHTMLGLTDATPVRFGTESREAEVTAIDVNLRAAGSDFRLVTPSGEADVHLQIPASFNVANALAAAAIGVALGFSVDDIARGLTNCGGVPGRMERIVAGQPFEVIVDYAHTGDAVRKVLDVLRGMSPGRLIVVVGAAGERDPGRRFGVGRAAAEGADFAVFTNEDPRSEDPTAIVQEIGRHAESAGRTRGEHFVEIEDRREAIADALRRAVDHDIVVICGKGHEQTIELHDQSLPWDDRIVTREELGTLGYGLG